MDAPSVLYGMGLMALATAGSFWAYALWSDRNGPGPA